MILFEVIHMNKLFRYKEKNSSIATELLGGLIVFLAMIYILPVNSSILEAGGADFQAVFIATAICSGICCILMGIFANYPIALSAGMGMNAYLAFSICGSLGYSFSEGLLLIFASGILFLILTLTPLRAKIITAMPKSLKYAISAGLGAFICFVGLQNGGIVRLDPSTIIALGDLSDPTVLLSLFGVILVLILMQFKGKIGTFAIVIAMAATAVLGLILGLCGVANMPKFTWSNTLENFSAFGNNFGKCFSLENFKIFLKPESYAIIFSLIFVNLFDTTATLIAVGKKVGFINEKGELINGKKAMIADSVGAIICAPLGTATVTSFAESTVGVESGAKTGLSSITVGILFLLSVFLYPVFSIFAGVESGLTPITSLALVSVGCLLFGNLKEIDWEDKIVVITSFLMVILMVLCYSISDGLGISIIAYCAMMLAAKRGKEVPYILYGIALFFVLSYVLKIVI